MKWFDVERGSSFKCPECGEGLDACNWDTEYGDPLHGDFDVACPYCEHEFVVSCWPTTIYSVKPLPPQPTLGSDGRPVE
jgi:DNA-directed RNA polymerase subunit RPC12/RpoP